MSTKRSRAAFESDDPPQHAPYAIYGTPLPGLDSDVRDDGSYVPVWKQEVTDERGRKRLHGAFTGGYSAGYFNTVGSKEGWTPATFVSSRSKRANTQKDGSIQRPEDFMDEEDLAEQAEAQLIGTRGAFAGLGGTADSACKKGMFADLFQNTGETIGVKLLHHMGWREGQGMGRKVKRRAEGDKTGEAHMFAPENTIMIALVRKIDRKGLGFAGETSLGEVTGNGGGSEEEDGDADARKLSANRSKILSKPRVKLKKSVIGNGVLNDTGSDDEDPYTIGPSLKYSRVISGEKKKRKGGLVTSMIIQKPSSVIKKGAQSKSPHLQGFRRCHDGRLPIDGFILSVQPLLVATEKKYPPPVLPPDWKPSRRATKFDAEARSFQSTADVAKACSLNPTARAALLGEAILPGKSVFDFISASDRDRLVSASGRADLPQAKGEYGPAGATASGSVSAQKTVWDLVPPLDAKSAVAALQRGKSGWLPYAEDPGKRERYTAFLSLRAGQQAVPTLPSRAPGTSTEVWAQELREFAQAAEVFKPISGLMATRFAPSSLAPNFASDALDPVLARAKTLDPAMEAAKAGMHGPLTRKTHQFYPTRLLCKRFNVKPPANVGISGEEGAAEEAKLTTDLVGMREMERLVDAANAAATMRPREVASAGIEGVEQASTVSEYARVDVEVNEALEGSRPGMEVYANVFGDGK